MLNMRNYDRTQKNRKVSFSMDGGLTWSDLVSDQTLIEPICQASMLMVSSGEEKTPTLLFLNPADKKSRQRICLRSSMDDGASWTGSLVLHEGSGAYSDLAQLPNGNIACLYEAGHSNPYQGIVFEVVSLLQIEGSSL
jgi:sialidase-1